MARPIKNYCDYFSHKSEMRNHRKIKALRTKFGLPGYAIWCMFLELLTGTDGNEIENSEAELELIAGDFGVSVTEISNVVNYCIKLELFSLRNGFIYQESLDDNLKPVYDKRQTAKGLSKKQIRKNGKFISNNTVHTDVTVVETPQTKVKETKVKEINNNTREIKIDGSDEIVIKNAERNPGYKNLIPYKQALVRKLIKKTHKFFPVDDEFIESGLINFFNKENYLIQRVKSKSIPDEFYYCPNKDEFYSLLDLLNYLLDDREFLNQTKITTNLTERSDVMAWLTHYAKHFYTEGLGLGENEIKKHIKYCWTNIPGQTFNDNKRQALLKKNQGR